MHTPTKRMERITKRLQEQMLGQKERIDKRNGTERLQQQVLERNQMEERSGCKQQALKQMNVE